MVVSGSSGGGDDGEDDDSYIRIMANSIYPRLLLWEYKEKRSGDEGGEEKM